MSDRLREIQELAEALRTPARRLAALRRLMLPATSDDLRAAVLHELVWLVASRHSDYEAAVSALRMVPSAALDANLWREMFPYLDGSDSEPFAHFAQLLKEMDRTADLDRLVQQARAFDDYDIREVAEDFG